MEGLFSGQAAAVARGWLRRESSGVSNSRWGGVVGVGALRLSERAMGGSIGVLGARGRRSQESEEAAKLLIKSCSGGQWP
jgi:hypothetical protein